MMIKLYKVGLRILIALALSIPSKGNAFSKVETGGREDSGKNSSPKNANVQTPATCGSITLTTQAQVDAFPATYGCTEITGTLTINGIDITNLDSLYFLKKVDGDLQISNNPNLTSMKGLSSLTYVGAGGPYPGLRITYNSSLTSINGLSKLTSIKGALEISNNSTLTNLDSLYSLASIGSLSPSYQCLTIANNPALTSLKGLRSLKTLPGPLSIANNSSLPNLNGLDSLKTIYGYAGSLHVTGNTSLANIDGLSALAGVTGGYTGVRISGNPSLPNLNGLSSLRQINGSPSASLEISNNTALTNVDALSSLRMGSASNYLTVTNNPQLAGGCGLYNILNFLASPNCYCGPQVSISGNGAGCTRDEILANCVPPGQGCIGDISLTSQKAIDAFPTRSCKAPSGAVTISGNDISNLDSLYVLTSVGKLIIINNGSLTTLKGLSGLTEVRSDFTIRQNGKLSDLDGLTALKNVGGNLTIELNPELINLGQFSALDSVTLQLRIIANPKLMNVDGLSSLRSAGSVSLQGNHSLTNVKGLMSIASYLGLLEIRSNDLLSNLDGLNLIKGVDYLGIANNGSLANIDGLSSLSTVGRSGIQIYNNPLLKNVNGLSSLTKIGYLSISGNSSLADLDGLSSLTDMESTEANFTMLDITNNPSLVRCCGLYPVLHNGGIGTVLISGNGAGCTKDDILAAGPCCTSPGGCAPPEPTAQPTKLVFANVNTTSMSVSFTSPSPSPTGFVTLVRSSSSPYPNDVPVDGIIYHVGDTIGNSAVAGFGNATSFNLTSLSASTVYYFDVFSHNNYNYLTVNPLAGNQGTTDSPTEPTAQPTDLTFTNVTDTTMTVSFTAATQAPGGYITLMQAFGSPYPEDAPVDGTTYHVGDVIGSSTIVVGVGRDTNLDIIYLSPGIDYYYDVFSYNISNGSYDYLMVHPLEGVQRTTSNGSRSARIAIDNAQKSSQYSEDPTGSDHLAPFPNPFSENITIPFSTTKQNAFVQIAIYDLMGKRIADVVSENFGPGYHEAKWAGTDNSGNKVLQGVYIYRIRTSETGSDLRGMLVAK